jgi:hypothetical protein
MRTICNMCVEGCSFWTKAIAAAKAPSHRHLCRAIKLQRMLAYEVENACCNSYSRHRGCQQEEGLNMSSNSYWKRCVW